MSLIVCPECGAKISDVTKQCVHCGYRFVVCPECGMVNSQSESLCASCGNSFVPSIMENEYVKEGQETKLGNNYIEAWKASSSFGRNFPKVKEVVSWIFYFLALCGIIAAYFIVSSWLNMEVKDVLDEFKKIENVQGVLCSSSTLVIIASMLIAIKFCVDSSAKVFQPIVLSNWMVNKSLDASHGLKQYSQEMDILGFKDWDILVKAGYITKYPSVKTQYILKEALFAIAIICCGLFLGLCVMQNLQFYCLKTILLEMSFEFQFLYFILAVVMFVIAIIVQLVGNSFIGNGEKDWLIQVYPDYKEVIGKRLDMCIK